MIVPISICLFILSFLVYYEGNKNKKIQNKSSETFWNQEQQSNFVSKKDLSNLNYLQVSIENLPFQETNDIDLIKHQEIVKKLISLPKVDLSNMTNTEIKLNFGTAHLTTITSYEQNYSQFLNALYHWGKTLIEKGLFTEAIQTFEQYLEYVPYKNQVYVDLANLYLLTDQPAKINLLIQKLTSQSHNSKQKTIESLRDILSTYN